MDIGQLPQMLLEASVEYISEDRLDDWMDQSTNEGRGGVGDHRHSDLGPDIVVPLGIEVSVLALENRNSDSLFRVISKAEI